jgi:RimJ/RimL family protein N-acetyltransferase
MQIVLERCTVRPWRLDDAQSIASHANNRKIWLGVRDLFPRPYTIQDAHEFLQRAISEQPEMKFCIEMDGTAVGGIGVHSGQDVHRRTATVGYWLGEQFWGRGIMTEVVTAVTDFCFDNFPLRGISAEVFANNPASARVLEKGGFSFEGRLKNNLMKDGQVLVPAYNEEHELSDTLAAVREAASAAARPYEIIVVDDASTDATPEIASGTGAKVIPINRRQIAAARNAGGRAAQGEYLFFIDADTRINRAHVTGGIAALEAGYAGGGARVAMDGFVPFWGRMLLRGFSSVYFGLNLGAGAFLFTTRRNFEAIGGFDEQYFAGEEVYFSIELKKLGAFKVLREPVLTSARKLRMYPANHFLRNFFGVIVRGPRGVRSRAKLSLWYDGKRERHPA